MPETVVRSFISRIGTSISHHMELVRATDARPRQAALEAMLAEQLAMRVIVQWEAFVHELLIAYVVRDPAKALSSTGLRIRRSTQDKFGAVAAGRTTFSEALPLDRLSAEGLVDPKGENVKATSANLLATVANENLGAQHARKFSLNASDGQFVDFTTALRNYLAHRSTKSWKELIQAKSALTGIENSPLTGSMSSIGTYLRLPHKSADSRAVYMAKRLTTLARKLR